MKMGKIIAVLMLMSMVFPTTMLVMADVEPNDDIQNAELIEAGKMYYGHLSPSDVVDWYKISVKKGDGLKITVGGDIRASVYDNSGKYVTNNWDLTNSQSTELIFYSANENGFAYIKIIENAITLDNRNYTLFIDIKYAPSPPRNLEIANVDSEKITLRWDHPENDGGVGLKYTGEGTGVYYKVYRDGKNIATVYLPSTGGSAPTTYTNTINIQGDYPRPEPGHNYTWYVTAVNWVGESEPSNTVHAGLKENSSSTESSGSSSFVGAPLLLIAVLLVMAMMWVRKRNKTS